ncbi:SusD-like starch-binding protein associating with outer membrane [Chitinophaga skermanii]|uniref:SusD-like starch-binding protein associating with outer membrane n=1 Tax=Chitinophaga skermanii TaxID=331697 RepID=A0A327R5P6_9BACT|nr:SusD/RagB family nutrient-binding outer membrane lipoprotein [Chitinophaga skermanii]RAJ10913.1 SusD-like starch-binding protein associating with outer membrane [Chitinophaga skermanii]
MKFTHLHKIFFTIGTTAALFSCNDFGDMNIDPTKSSSMDPGLQIALVEARFSGDLTTNERIGAFITVPIVQHLGGAWGAQYGAAYVKQESYFSALWAPTYLTDVLNISDAVNRTKGDATKTNMNAVARILKVYSFARLTDLHGDIPYKQASSGYSQKITFPEYDKQEDIYTDFFKELAEASAQLDPAKDPVPTDLWFKGNIAQWKTFANSLHLRLAMRLTKVNPTKAREEAEKAFAAGVMNNVNDIVLMRHADIQNTYDDLRGNGLSGAMNQDPGMPFRMSQTFVDYMRGTNDPRLPKLARYYLANNSTRFKERIDITEQVVAVGGWTGVAPGKYNWDDWMNTIYVNVPGVGSVEADNNAQKMQPANFLLSNNAPFLHLTLAEVEFLTAEACFRWNLTVNGGDYKYHYNKGIEAAFYQLSLFPNGPTFTNTQLSQFQADNVLAPGRELQMINSQLWVALFLNGPEAYANWRRSGFPNLTPGYVPGLSNSETIPRRFEYPLIEREQNAANYQKAADALGGNSWNKRVWWDKEL